MAQWQSSGLVVEKCLSGREKFIGRAVAQWYSGSVKEWWLSGSEVAQWLSSVSVVD